MHSAKLCRMNLDSMKHTLTLSQFRITGIMGHVNLKWKILWNLWITFNKFNNDFDWKIMKLLFIYKFKNKLFLKSINFFKSFKKL